MLRHLTILSVAVVVVALPFLLRRGGDETAWRAGDPVLVIVSPHNEAIRYEFGRAFSTWHARLYGQPAKVDWRNIGGTTEIMRYLSGEYVAAFRAWWQGQGKRWPRGGGEMILDAKFKADQPPADIGKDPAAEERWRQKNEVFKAFRGTDDANAFTGKIDLFFGGGSYDHSSAFQQGLTVPPWAADGAPPDTLTAADGGVLVPERFGGETWRTATFFGNALSSFGICYNVDRLRELNLPPPAAWEDLADPGYFRQIGAADPTKSGSIAKAFEMIIHQQCRQAVKAAGFTDSQITDYEARIGKARLPAGQMPEGVPSGYQAALEAGWLQGLRVVQRIGANARYFTDSASKVPIDVSVGDAAAGIVIDFYGRVQADVSAGPQGELRMAYVTPPGGTSISADPISLLRGAEHRELAVRFMNFVLSEDGQRLWNYRPGTPGGPAKYALHRLPVRRDFYPASTAAGQATYLRHRVNTGDDLGDPGVNPYELGGQFNYEPRWTARHFGVQRDLIRAMCMDAGEELRAAWLAIIEHGGPAAQPEAMALLGRMPDRPEPLTWAAAPEIGKRYNLIDVMREWTVFFRENYRRAARVAQGSPG
jgi:ABC-type Fe3+ transport system substrate-binding protein